MLSLHQGRLLHFLRASVPVPSSCSHLFLPDPFISHGHTSLTATNDCTMQHLSAYLVEIPGLPDAGVRVLRGRVNQAVDEWLVRKGGGILSQASRRSSPKNQAREGAVRQSLFASEQGELREILLEEPTVDGVVFCMALRVVRTSLFI
jgi:hypothetical protein